MAVKLVRRLLVANGMRYSSPRKSYRRDRAFHAVLGSVVVTLAGVLACSHGNAADLYRDGASARAMALGGSATAIADDPRTPF